MHVSPSVYVEKTRVIKVSMRGRGDSNPRVHGDVHRIRSPALYQAEPLPQILQNVEIDKKYIYVVVL